jgi:hypothetical protein
MTMPKKWNKAWSAPFADWVVAGWREHSQSIGGPQIAARVRLALSRPDLARKRAEARARKEAKA